MNFLRNYSFWQIVLAAMLVPLAIMAFWPSPIDQPMHAFLADFLGFLHRHGTPRWFNYKLVEASANVVLFVPLGIVSSLAFWEKRWWQIGAFGLLISGCMELGQLLFLHNRVASPVDLMTNTSGAVLGALVASGMVKRLKVRSRSAADLL